MLAKRMLNMTLQLAAGWFKLAQLSINISGYCNYSLLLQKKSGF